MSKLIRVVISDVDGNVLDSVELELAESENYIAIVPIEYPKQRFSSESIAEIKV